MNPEFTTYLFKTIEEAEKKLITIIEERMEGKENILLEILDGDTIEEMIGNDIYMEDIPIRIYSVYYMILKTKLR